MTTKREQGRVFHFRPMQGYGFVEIEGAHENVFCHVNSIRGQTRGGARHLHDGDLIEFELFKGPKGLKAQDIVVLEYAM